MIINWTRMLHYSKLTGLIWYANTMRLYTCTKIKMLYKNTCQDDKISKINTRMLLTGDHHKNTYSYSDYMVMDGIVFKHISDLDLLCHIESIHCSRLLLSFN